MTTEEIRGFIIILTFLVGFIGFIGGAIGVSDPGHKHVWKVIDRGWDYNVRKSGMKKYTFRCETCGKMKTKTM